MKRNKVAETYTTDFLEIERPQPLSDLVIERLIQDVLSGSLDKDISDRVYENFKHEMPSWLFASQLNFFYGFDNFTKLDIINGCTQFIDNLYMQGPVQVITDDYRYHQRLGLAAIKDVGNLQPYTPLIIAMPFPQIGSVHTDMTAILDEAKQKNIPVHIDGAWLTCCRGIDFDVSHESIQSVGISLSKGLGLGWNRIGLRWSKIHRPDSITLMNDFSMVNRALVMIGLHFLRRLPTDYLWTTYNEIYMKVCRDFDLTPTNAVYLALRNRQPVGISPLIRHVAEQ